MSDTKSKPQYTAQDSASFKRYEDFLRTHGATKEDLFSDEFRARYKTFKGLDTPPPPPPKKSRKEELEAVEPKVPGYTSTAQTEMSDAIAESSLRLEGLQKSYDADYLL